MQVDNLSSESVCVILLIRDLPFFIIYEKVP